MDVSTNNILKKVVQKTIDLLYQYPEQDISMFGTEAYRWGNWDWSTGVALYGIINANEILKDQKIILKLKEWIDARIENESRKICVNTTTPLITVLFLNKLYPDLKYENICKDYNNYLMNNIQRISNGAINHTTVRYENNGEVWADTLFMSIIYLSQRGVFLNYIKFSEEALDQLYSHLEVLIDKSSGLFYHGWNDNENKQLGVKWGRGNAWITASIIDILNNSQQDSQKKNEILSILDKQLSTLEKLQDKDGFWKTVLDVDLTYQETTVTAGFIYGILKGIRIGLVNSKYQTMALKAVKALLSKIDSYGLLQWASAGTSIKKDVKEYNEIPYEVTPYAQGLAIMALSEIEKL